MSVVLPPYPEIFPADAAMVIVEKIRGVNDHTLNCCIHAAAVLELYALGQFFPDPHHTMRVHTGTVQHVEVPDVITPNECADCLDSYCKGLMEGKHMGINWKPILSVLLSLIQQWLNQ